jgi:TolA-binding protein
MRTKSAPAFAALAIFFSLLHASTVHAETAAGLFADAEQHFQKGEYEAALTGYRGVVDRYPGDWHASQARFTEGFILQKKMGKLKQAREAFQHVAEKDSTSALAEHALFHMASVDEKSGETDKAIQGFSELAKKPRHGRDRNAKKRAEFLKSKKAGKKDPPPGWAYGLTKHWYRKMMRP